MALMKNIWIWLFLGIGLSFPSISEASHFISDNEIGMRALNVTVSVNPQIFKLFDKQVSKCTVVLKHLTSDNNKDVTFSSPFLLTYPYVRKIVEEEKTVDEKNRINPHKMDKLNQKIELSPNKSIDKKILIFNDLMTDKPFQIIALLLFEFQSNEVIRKQIESRQGVYSDLIFFLDEIFDHFGIVLMPEVCLLKVNPFTDNLAIHLDHNPKKSEEWGAAKNVFSNSFHFKVEN